MKIKEVIRYLEELAPPFYAESFDNVGLLVGSADQELTRYLVTLDITEQVLDEAIEQDCNFIITFHPIIFLGLKKLCGDNYVEKIVIKAIQNNIAIYAIHTNLDNAIQGVNDKICKILNLQNTQILCPRNKVIKKLITYVPLDYADKLRLDLFKIGAGEIGNYQNCSFNIQGLGTFKGNEKSNPTFGQKGVLHSESEICITVNFPKHLENNILNQLFESHPYEEVAYEVITLDNKYQNIGMGMVGILQQPMDEILFLRYLKEKMNTRCIRHTKLLNKKVQKIAVLGGSGSFALKDAKRVKADVFISSDFKYHDFFNAENDILIADVGHYESEQFTKNLLVDFLNEKMPKFAPILSIVNTNPINYI